MRLDRAVPETPRRAGRRGIEEIVEVPGVIVVADAGRWRLRLAHVESAARHRPRPPVEVRRHTRPPALLRVADEPALLRERLAPALELGRKITDVIRRRLERPRVATGEHRNAAGIAHRILREGPLETHPARREPVEIRRLHHLARERPAEVAQVVGHDEEDVGLPFRLRLSRRGRPRKTQKARQEQGQEFHFGLVICLRFPRDGCVPAGGFAPAGPTWL